MDDSELQLTEVDEVAVEVDGGGTAQLYLLERAIQENPGAPVNYLLRGEEWLLIGEWDRAKIDLEAARDLAENLLRQSAWGYIYQAYLDRAELALSELAGLTTPGD
jgi:hypothetical protein